jgi:hypothetical protein
MSFTSYLIRKKLSIDRLNPREAVLIKGEKTSPCGEEKSLLYQTIQKSQKISSTHPFKGTVS